MSIANKLTYLGETKIKIKDSINLTGIGITNEPFRQYSTKLKDAYVDIINNGIETLYSNFPKVSGEDTNLSLTPTYQAPLLMDLKGNTQQTGTPTPSSPIPVNVVSGDNEIEVCGKNLFDKDNANILDNTYINPSSGKIDNANGTKTLYIPCKPNTTYTIQKTLSARFVVCTTNSIPAYLSQVIDIQEGATANNLTITTSANANYLCVFYYYSTYDTTITEQQIRDSIQIEQGSNATTYKPYTGTTYNIDLPIENLLNNILTTQEVSGITFTKNTDGSVSISGTATADIIVQLTNNMKFLKVGNTYTLSGCASRGSLQTYRLFVRGTSIVEYGDGVTFTLQQSVFDSSNGIAIGITNGTNIQTPILFKPQIELGSKVNTFTPYGTTPIELNKIPNTNYEDRIFHAKDGDTYYDSLDSATKQTLTYDKWYLHKETIKLDMASITDYEGAKGQFYKVGFVSGYGIKNDIMYSNIFLYSTTTWLDLHFGITSLGNLWFSTGDKTLTISTINTWLLNKNAVLYGILSTPTNTEITYTPLIEQLNALEQAQSYEGTTNINQVNNDLPFIISASALEKD